MLSKEPYAEISLLAILDMGSLAYLPGCDTFDVRDGRRNDVPHSSGYQITIDPKTKSEWLFLGLIEHRYNDHC